MGDPLLMPYANYANYSLHDRMLTKYGALYGPLPEGLRMFYPYHVCTTDGIAEAHAATEADAIRDAESRARANPGKAYFVTKAIAKSYVAPAPAITTRL